MSGSSEVVASPETQVSTSPTTFTPSNQTEADTPVSDNTTGLTQSSSTLPTPPTPLSSSSPSPLGSSSTHRKIEFSSLPSLGNVKVTRAAWPVKASNFPLPIATKKPEPLVKVNTGSSSSSFSGRASPEPAIKAPVSATNGKPTSVSFLIPKPAWNSAGKKSLIKKLESKYLVSISSKPQENEFKDWSLSLVQVAVSGTEPNTKTVQEVIEKHADASRRFRSSLKVPARIAPFFPRMKYAQDNDSETDEGTKVTISDDDSTLTITVNGKIDDILETMRSVESTIAQISADLVSSEPIKREKSFAVSLPSKLFLTKYGAVISETDEGFIVTAPATQLAAAQAALVKNIASQVSVTLDSTSLLFNGFAGHAKMLTRYFQVTNELTDIENEHSVKISFDANGVYTISGDKNSVESTKQQLIKILSMHSPSAHIAVKGMRYPLCRAVAARAAAGVKMPIKVVWGSSDELYIVHTDPTMPALEIRESVLDAQGKFAIIGTLIDSIRTKNVDMEHPEYISSPLGEEAKNLLETVCTESANLEDTRARFEVFPTKVVLSGSKEAIDRAAPVLYEVSRMSKKYSILANYTVDIPFDNDLVANLIGRGGSNINALREKYGVSIDANNGRVVVQGIPDAVKKAAADIKEQLRRLRDTKTEELTIPRAYLPIIIGARGRTLNKLSEKYSCRINVVEDKSDDVKEVVKKDGEEVAVIMIIGSVKNVSAVKSEIMDIVNYERKHAFSDVLEVPTKYIGYILGKNATSINKITHDTGADINIPKNDNRTSDSVEILFKGSKKQIEDAVRAVKNVIDSVENTSNITIDIPEDLVKILTPEKRTEFVKSAGGDPEDVNRPMTILTHQHKVRLSGTKKVVESLEKAVNEFAAEYERNSCCAVIIQAPMARLRELLKDDRQLIQDTQKTFNTYVFLGTKKNDLVPVTVKGPTDEAVQLAVKNLNEKALLIMRKVDVVASAFSDVFRRNTSSRHRVRLAYNHVDVSRDRTNVTTKLTVSIYGGSEEDVEKCVADMKPVELVTKCTVIPVGDKMRSLIGRNGQRINGLRKRSPALLELDQGNLYVYSANDKADEEAQTLVNKTLEEL